MAAKSNFTAIFYKKPLLRVEQGSLTQTNKHKNYF